ncbi:MAG: hypothetical protein A3G75_12530 [Verrucomicrobia bacterium RIFCSPLOWO2_12_FULL_64_8]|nr:MAG: hypothetical protein A3G75_12530 [Verrucomicrobia bacterium RIFCSPLOWO2_12_FULL_64_8]
MTAKEDQIAQGKAVVAAVMSSYGTAVLLIAAFAAALMSTQAEVVGLFIQNAITVGVFYLIWTGRAWAKWAFAALCAIAVIYIIVMLARAFDWKVALLVVYFALLPVALKTAKSVDVFIEDQERRRIEAKQASEPAAAAAAGAPCSNVPDLPPPSRSGSPLSLRKK